MAWDRTTKKIFRLLRRPIVASGTDHKENNSSHCCTFSVNRQRLLLRLYHFYILLLISFILDDYTRTGLDDMEKTKFLTLPGLEQRPLYRPVRSQSLYRLRYPGSFWNVMRELNISLQPVVKCLKCYRANW
jgi:hypothetical protein